MTSSRLRPSPESRPGRHIPRRGALGLLAGLPTAIAAACTAKPESPTQRPSNAGSSAAPTQTGTRSPSPAQTPTPSSTATRVRVKGVGGGLAELAEALYGGKEVATTDATAVLADRGQPPTSEVTVTGSAGEWHGESIGVLAQGGDLTFAVRDGAAWTVVAGRWPGLGIDQVHAGDRQFVLIIGSDAREAEGQKITRSRGDALHIAGVDGDGGAGILGIPRDSWTSIGKINSALAYNGPTGQTEAVASLTGLPVKHYVLTGFNGFRRFVGALGGVTVNNPHGMPGRNIPQGTVHLARERALRFARERKSLPNGDFDRSANQQRLLVAFALAMKSMGPSTFGKLASILSRATRTDLPAENALQYAAWAWSIKTSKLVRAVATGGFGTRSGQSVVLLGAEAEELFRDFADGNLSQR